MQKLKVWIEICGGKIEAETKRACVKPSSGRESERKREEGEKRARVCGVRE